MHQGGRVWKAGPISIEMGRAEKSQKQKGFFMSRLVPVKPYKEK